jgi:tetratricopeptide (TPR) repeat protein
MQQYRFNFPLFIGLIVGTLVCSTAVYGLWRFQINRKSGWLLGEAEKALKENDFRNATKYFRDYLSIDRSNEDVRIKHGLANLDLLKSDDVTQPEFGKALQELETTVRSDSLVDNPETKKLRRGVAEIWGEIGQYQTALEHLTILLQSDPDDPDLQALRATYLARSGDFNTAVRESFKLIGYDSDTDEFDADKAIAKGHVELYTNLAVTLQTKQDKPELAERVMDQLVEVNPESAQAHLARGRFQLSLENVDEARSEFEEAYKLKPQEADVLLSMAEMATRDEQYDKASEYLTSGKKLFPEDMRFYRTAAALLMKQEQPEKAIAEIDEGIKKVKTNDQATLMYAKVELQFAQNDLNALKQSVDDMERTAKNIRPEFIDYFRARIMMAENKWPQAKAALSRLRPKMSELTRGQTVDIDAYLGLCYEKLAQFDMARESYQQALAQNPEYDPAKLGLERVKKFVGLSDETEAPPQDDELARLFDAEMKKPKAERNYKKLEELVQTIAKEKEWDDLRRLTTLAQIKSSAEDFAGARKLLLDARKLAPENLIVWRLLIQSARQDPKIGPQKAQQAVEQAIAKLGDVPGLRIEKANNLVALNAAQPNKEELKTELTAIAEGIDQWTPLQKAELWGGLAQLCLNLGLNDEARHYLTLSTDVRPDDLPLRVTMFNLALEANDDAGMKEAQDEILKVVGSNEDNVWLFTEARRKLSLIRRGQLDRKAIDEIRPLVNRALEQRKEWHELYVLNGELEVEAGNLAKALESFDRAQELGRPYPAATAQHIKLLSFAGRLKQAGELLERIPEALRYPLLGQLYPEILFRTNRVEEALTEARDAIEANPNNAQSHFWYSQLLARSAQPKPAAADTAAPASATQAAAPPAGPQQPNKEVMAQAIKEMRRALELQPEFPDAWGALIRYYSLLNDNEQAQAVLREAQLSLSGDNLQFFLARSYESLGRWFDAETMYRAIYESAPDDLARTQQLAAFYLSDAYPLSDKNVKATPLLNKILRAGAEKKVRSNDPGLFWARRMAAKMLAATRDYQDLRKAEMLLASNSQNGDLTIDDKLAMAEILAERPEPEHRQKAIQLLESVAQVQTLAEKHDLILGNLYFLTRADWRKYSNQMRRVTARYPTSLAARAAFVKNLIERGDKESLDEAADKMRQMIKIAPNHPVTFELTVRLANKRGKQAEARERLLKSVPDLAKIQTMTEQDRLVLATIANLLIELEDVDNAERIYRKVAELDPNQNLTLASFLGNHRSVEQCFEKLNEIYTPERIPMIAQVALVVVRKQREKVGNKFDAQIQSWLDAGLNENPESIALLMDQADFYDIQQRYDEAAAIYQKLLANKDLTGIRRAIVLNNLSFLVALAGSKAKVSADPLKLVEEAVEIMGPNSDILDTRAVVFISLKRYQEAIEDLELSVTDNPTASKYFHKAHAHLMAGENLAAVEAWKKAEELGLNHDSINLMEIKLFDQLKSRIDQLRGSSVTQADGRRRAG